MKYFVIFILVLSANAALGNLTSVLEPSLEDQRIAVIVSSNNLNTYVQYPQIGSVTKSYVSFIHFEETLKFSINYFLFRLYLPYGEERE